MKDNMGEACSTYGYQLRFAQMLVGDPGGEKDAVQDLGIDGSNAVVYL